VNSFWGAEMQIKKYCKLVEKNLSEKSTFQLKLRILYLRNLPSYSLVNRIHAPTHRHVKINKTLKRREVFKCIRCEEIEELKLSNTALEKESERSRETKILENKFFSNLS
jgi:hypothetical protein